MKIGSLHICAPVIAAPMAGVTDLAARYIASRFGAALTVTEMASSKGIIKRDRKTLALTRTHPDARPYAVQIFGNDPAEMGEAAAKMQELGADAVDVNLGCPVRKILKSGNGGALLKNLPLVDKILASIRRSVSIPLMIKIRAGFDPKSRCVSEIARLAEANGVDAITLHPRYVTEGFAGSARWEIIAELAAATTIPIIGSGDVRKPEDAARMMSETGCAAVMVGRAAMGNPFIFREIAALIEGRERPAPPSNEEKLSAAMEQFELMRGDMPERVAVWLWRKHLVWFTRGLQGAAEIRRRVFQTEDPELLIQIAREFLTAIP